LIELPRWLLTGTYAPADWSVGLHFTPEILAHAFRALPKVGAVDRVLRRRGAVLSWMLGIDAPIAYLATSPGAMETVAIITASSHVDVPFIIALTSGINSYPTAQQPLHSDVYRFP
jgi:uncharacterized protein